MSRKKLTYNHLLVMGYSKESIHSVLHALMLEKIQYDKQRATKRNFLQKLITPRFTPISGKALSLLKTLFAKKPKSPV